MVEKELLMLLKVKCFQQKLIFVIRRVFVCMELSSKSELICILYN